MAIFAYYEAKTYKANIISTIVDGVGLLSGCRRL